MAGYHYKKIPPKSWPGGSVGWSVIPCTKGQGVRAPVGTHMEGNRLMFLSHIDASLSNPCLSHSVSLSLKSINIFSGED